MKVIHAPEHGRHDPQFFLVRGMAKPSAEKPERAQALLAAVERQGHEVLTAEAFGPGPRAAIHTPEYLQFLETAWEEWQALGDSGGEIIANVHPGRRPASYPQHIVGRAGWHMADTACPIGTHTWEAACRAADTAVHGASLLLDGADEAYALCRPPGHHAYADMAGGFCFLNNAAIAAQHLRQAHERVAILDVDLHHGNGTQGVFYRRRDVLTVSIHADPAHFYPFFWGHAQERGKGEGEGFNLNLPLPLGSGDEPFLEALIRAFGAIRAYAPGVLVVALGLDAFAGDPLAGLAVTTEGFAQIAGAIAREGFPTLLVQEGGYLTPELGENLESFLQGFEGARK
ncbi:histone deacetylase family protein [Aquibaculum sediminis]|uniref:histone deacetylase family protein n=1 Tax=Aquibaculum sediminis TaxID=3231907 RepID=UPI003453DF4D